MNKINQNQDLVLKPRTSYVISHFITFIFFAFFIILDLYFINRVYDISLSKYMILALCFFIAIFLYEFFLSIYIPSKIVLTKDKIIYYNILNKAKTVEIKKITKVSECILLPAIKITADDVTIYINEYLNGFFNFIQMLKLKADPKVFNIDIYRVFAKYNLINAKVYNALLYINKLKNKNKYNKICRYCKKLNKKILADVLRYLYISKDISDFNLFRYILEKNYKHIKLLPNLDMYKLDLQRFKLMLDTIINITSDDFIDVNNFSYIILLNNKEYFKCITDKQKEKIVNSLYDIQKFINYIKVMKQKANDYIVNYIIIRIQVAKYFNNQRLLLYVLQYLKLQNSQIKLYAIDSVIYNEMFVKDEYIEDVASDFTLSNILYNLLLEQKKQDLFPSKYLNQEHFVISDFSQWLYFCGPQKFKKIRKIDIVSKVKYNELVYYILKFCIDSKGFDANDAMLGISGGYIEGNMPCAGNSGYTFSLFEKFDDKNYQAQALKIIEKFASLEENMNMNVSKSGENK